MLGVRIDLRAYCSVREAYMAGLPFRVRECSLRLENSSVRARFVAVRLRYNAPRTRASTPFVAYSNYLLRFVNRCSSSAQERLEPGARPVLKVYAEGVRCDPLRLENQSHVKTVSSSATCVKLYLGLALDFYSCYRSVHEGPKTEEE